MQKGRAPTADASRYPQRLAKHGAHDNEVILAATSADVAWSEVPLSLEWHGDDA